MKSTSETAEMTAAEFESILDTLWSALNSTEQTQALEAFWSIDDSDTRSSRQTIELQLAGALRFRVRTLEQATAVKKAEYLKRFLKRKPFLLSRLYLLRAWLIEKHRPLLISFLEGGGIPHVDGFASADEPPGVDQFEAAIQHVKGLFDPRDIALHLFCLFTSKANGNSWAYLPNAPSFQESIDQVFADSEESVTTTEPVDSEMVEDPDNANFTSLDNHLIQTLVASAFHEEGALKEDAVEDLLEEVVEMNAARHRSLFHRGFFHALFEKSYAFHFPGENSERRQWYLCGVLFGLLRRNEIDLCIDIFAVSQKELGKEIVASSKSLCGAKLLPLLFLPLLRSGHLKLVQEFVRGQFDRLASTSLRISVAQGLLDYASKLLREGKAAEGEPLFDLVGDLLDDEENGLPETYRIKTEAWVKRRKAQCLQAKGSFPAARSILLSLDMSDKNVAPQKTFADLGLIEGGFRSLAMVLPKAKIEQNRALVDGLKRGVRSFNQAVDCGGGKAANAHFCLGVLQTLESPTLYAQDRADCFQTAIGGMLEDAEAYNTNGILDWTGFLLALALLETAEPSNYLPASDLVPRAIETDLRFPPFLWERMFEAAALFDDSGLAILIAEYLLSCREEATECLLVNAALLARSEPLFDAVLRRFLCRKMPIRKCWARLVELLPVALQHQALEVAGTILDKLESMAFSNKEFRGPFMEILKDSDRYSPAWESEDAQESLVNLMEIEGQKEEAAQILRERFFQVRAGGSSHNMIAARQVIERLESLNVESSQVNDLSELLGGADCGSANVPIGDVISGHVLYIGGNETQASYQRKIESELKSDHPDLTVAFYFPGWDSNWNIHLAKLKPMIDQVDVVVINSLIRTQLGRHLRGYCNAEHPWLPCTGRGFESLKRSIIRAVIWVNSN